MKKRVLSLLMAAMSVAMFGILYPEYILLSDTYEYIIEENLQKIENPEHCSGNADLSELLYAEPEQIQVSSKLLQYLAEEGIIEWKN
jgi:hypothetical protein